ncbi:MAG TPA: endonuclease III [Oligoflexia bacterium]|nr:endonuclease III [Oligoflexia bacterium]HMP27363.1 endonuclease III [Oligoflexia bacterium]
MNEQSLQQLVKILNRLYPKPKSELNFKNHYQLLIAVVLSAQCTDRKVNQVTKTLFKKFPSFKTLAAAPPAEVEQIIREVNYYKTKSKNIIELSKKIRESFDNKLPSDFDSLLSLPGVGRKTANVILGELGTCQTFPVDTHVKRVSLRLGLTKHTKPEKIEEDLKKIFEPSLWRRLHHQMIFHGRRVCLARSPLCNQCALQAICPSAKQKTVAK